MMKRPTYASRQECAGRIRRRTDGFSEWLMRKPDLDRWVTPRSIASDGQLRYFVFMAVSKTRRRPAHPSIYFFVGVDHCPLRTRAGMTSDISKTAVAAQ